MSLTNIKLPDSVIADLYRQTLVQDDNAIQTSEPVRKVQAVENRSETPAEPEPKPIQAPPATKGAGAYKVLGNNKRNIAVVVDFPNEVLVPESDLQFLTKMLSACKLNLADVAIINHATSEVAIDKLKEQLQPRHVLLFGVEPTTIRLPISFPAFKEQAYAGTTYLFSPGLGQLNQETEEARLIKRKLWDCLKHMFV